jgi:hypothetical protein
MPTPLMKKYAQEAGCSLEHVEDLWAKAKEIAKGKFDKEDAHFWAYVNGIVRKGLKLKEAMTFKEFVSIEYDSTTDEATPIACLITGLFKARDIAHKLHLHTDSYAVHMALNDLYDQLVSYADSFAEAYQGKHGLINFEQVECNVQLNDQDAKQFVADLAAWLDGPARALFDSKDTYLVNMHDEVLTDVYSAKYKIDNLS